MQGGKLAGGNPENGRVDNDFYATDPEAVTKLFDALKAVGACPEAPKSFLEPCVGNGNIAGRTLELFPGVTETTCMDIVDRGYPGTIVHDFLSADLSGKKYDLIVSNPPYLLPVLEAHADMEQRPAHRRERQAMGHNDVPRMVRVDARQQGAVPDHANLGEARKGCPSTV